VSDLPSDNGSEKITMDEKDILSVGKDDGHCFNQRQ